MAHISSHTMSRRIGDTRKPPDNVVDIRDDFGTKVYRGKKDPYDIGSPRAESTYRRAAPRHSAITNIAGKSRSPIARKDGRRGNTVVPIRKQPQKELNQTGRETYIDEVKRVIPDVQAPNLEVVKQTREQLMKTLTSFGGRSDEIARNELDAARKAFYAAFNAIEQSFVAWKEHVIDLIIASQAYRAGRDGDLVDDFEALSSDWETSSLVSRRDPVDIGLSKKIGVLIDILNVIRDESLPAITIAQDQEQWRTADIRIRELASNIRLDVVKVVSHMVETLEPTLLTEELKELVRLARKAARSLLQPPNVHYNRSAVALAIHRMLPAMKSLQQADATKQIALAYHNLIGVDDTPINLSLIRSYGNLVRNSSDSIIASAKMTLEPSLEHLEHIAQEGATLTIRNAAVDTQTILSSRLAAVAGSLSTLTTFPGITQK